MVEDELIQQAKQGDLHSFNQLIGIYQREVYNLCLRMLGDAASADDATQEAFISAYRGIGKFRGGVFRAWLFKIAGNKCRDHLRARRRAATISLDDLPVELESRQRSPEDYASGRELGGYITRALAALPPDLRMAVVLRDIEELEYAEIAQVTGWSLGTVKSRISRGRAALRPHLERYRELFP
jgi:RNA polymerase sigma-70 factor (ECF subfamily)